MADDAELGLRLIKGIRAACQSRDPDGKPVRGKLVSLALNITSDGWQAITQYWSTNDWNVSVGKDPVACLVEVLSKEPDLSAPYEPKRRAAAALPVLPLAERIVAGAAPEPVVQVDDVSTYLAEALSTTAGEQVIINHVAAKKDDGDLSDLLV
ncbi:hypothetical protein EN759_00360 [Mesorhizobium sp. M00.F.Ca.ET.038.03.1.1]|nr:hypothetical protein EN759_00360 [Mesorhizobium sp. M00.F.Ca.ET.038.03.1.1]